MTRKQEALYKLNLLRAALNMPTVTPKKAEKMAYGVVVANIEWAKKSLPQCFQHDPCRTPRPAGRHRPASPARPKATGRVLRAAPVETNLPRRRAAVLIGETNMRIRDILADLIGVIAIFGTAYGLLLIGYGIGF